jgi:alkaline phosphatase
VRIVVFVADGAGIATWSAGYLAADGAGRALAVSTFPVTGFIDSRNVSRPTPESASAATALATGVPTYYHAVGVGADSQPRTTVLEAAEAAGLATGIVTTTIVVDATPAAFVAHVPDRDERGEIAAQIAAAPLEVLMGDGRGWFDGTLRPDGRDLLTGMARRATLVESGDALRGLDPGATEALVGFFPSDSLRDPALRDPSLAEMTRAALAILDHDDDGFFLMVENEHTDHSTHENRPYETIAAEVLSLDDAVAEALTYRHGHPETLVLVVSDHETGGMSLFAVSGGGVEARYGATGHSLSLVPLFATGPGAERFDGIHRIEEVGRLLLEMVRGAE